MRIPLMLVVGLIIFTTAMSGLVGADPVKWSVPMDHYPNPWSPTAAPPNYQNYYPYAGYGYGGSWGGYPGYGGYYQGGHPGTQQGGFSGNPYQQQYYYGQ